ncbi:MAG: methyltransferase domain-containing protein [Chloroflexi bacterium]|nr:methyltransferase domain-containing protein [Chloroflexota bacterium]
MKYEPWQVWGTRPEVESTLEARGTGDLPEMECTKQLVALVREVYQPGMRVLDVGCNVGHYLRGLRRLDPKLCYVGVDAYPYYIEKAKAIFGEDERTAFLEKDIMEALFPDDPFDIVFCCNVILHLPYFEVPIRNLVESTKRVCFVRTLLGENTTIVKLVRNHVFDAKGEPLDFSYQNTYKLELVADYITRDLGCGVEVIEDEFDPKVIADEFGQVKKGSGTRVVDGKQVDGNIIFGWKFLKITK